MQQKLGICSILSTLFAIVSTICSAQDSLEIHQTTFCPTGLSDQPRPTFFKIQRYRSGSYQMRQGSGNNLTVQDNSSISVSLRAPIVLRPGLKVLSSVTYYDEDFEFVQNDESSALSYSLHNKSLRSLNASLYVIKPFRGNWFLINRLQASLNGDFHFPEKGQYMNYSLASVVGWRKRENTILGLGLFYGVDFEGGSLLPLVAFQHAFNNRWSLDALLPSQTTLRYFSRNRTNVLEAGVQLNGPEYNIHLDYPAAASQQFLFRRNEVRWSVNAKREIHDWLWMGLELGVNTPISSQWQTNDVNVSGESFEYTIDNHFFSTFTLFLVPPQKLFDRH
ncbi:MAG: DUF6268 family outer membrane beta-barrel protein [Bacteroidota bacterium]